MRKTKRRREILYQRGIYRLERDERADGSLRSPFLAIFWYDPGRKRERSRTTGTANQAKGQRVLDAFYVERHGGIPRCPACGQTLEQSGELVTVLVANYLETKPAGDAVHPRLAHILDFMEATDRLDDRCGMVDEAWAESFRIWLAAKPDRARAPATIENSLIQLAAAFRLGKVEPGFTTIPTTELSRTPQHRSTVAELARMFRYCLTPTPPKDRTWSPDDVARRRRERESLLRFLRASVATWGRPDAVHDIDTSRKRGQWHPQARVLALNPAGRRQTKKRRATVPIAHQFAPHLDLAHGSYVGVASVKTAWESMADALDLPKERESGMKLVRRSMMTLARRRLGEEHWIQGRMMAGHVPVTVSDLYALFDPANLGRALAVTEAVIDEIEAAVPGAFAVAENVAILRRGN